MPRRASPRSVNWETTSTSPPTSCTERFILPFSSSKMRRFAIFWAAKARVLLAVARLHADEHEQAGADFRYELAPDGNLGARDALDYDSHASDSFLASAMCSSDRPR